MDLRFSGLKSVHSTLSNVIIQTKRESKGIVTPNEFVGEICGVEFDHVKLQSPLDRGVLYISRNQKTYSAGFVVVGKTPYVFLGLSKYLRRQLKQHWVQVDSQGCGYILDDLSLDQEQDQPQSPLLAIIDGAEGHNRAISLGAHGARIQTLDTFGDFKNHLRKLEDFSNVFLNCCFQNLLAKKQIKTIPDYTLTISI